MEVRYDSVYFERMGRIREVSARMVSEAEAIYEEYRAFRNFCEYLMEIEWDHSARHTGSIFSPEEGVVFLEDASSDEYREQVQRYNYLRSGIMEQIWCLAERVEEIGSKLSSASEEELALLYKKTASLLLQAVMPECFPPKARDEWDVYSPRGAVRLKLYEIGWNGCRSLSDAQEQLAEAERQLKCKLESARTAQKKSDRPKASASAAAGKAVGMIVGGLVGGAVMGAAAVGNAVAGMVGSLLDRKHSSEPVSDNKEKEKAAAAPKPQAAAPILAEEARSDNVQFQGVAPHSIDPGEYFTVKIMMYREEDHLRAEREAALVADKVKKASSSVCRAEQGQEFRVALQSPDVELDITPEYMRWNGIFAAADFEVFLPENFTRKQLRLRGRVYSGDAVVTDLKLILQVSSADRQAVPCRKEDLRSAFVSYASDDRAKVAARIQGILLARPEMELFFDVESLRRGEEWEPRLYKEISRRDLFYLFWSQNAAASQWVRKELDYALSQKTVEYIEPIPLESPEVCPPPECLMCKHFNDWTLRYTKNL